ncbi:MAG: hypothetical protein WCJ57_01385 [Candidatus Falkowbacteria bacterium]
MSSKYFKLFTIFSLSLSLLFFCLSVANAQECPRGLVNDPAPGVCGLYVDEDSNSICDLSEDNTKNVSSINLNDPVPVEAVKVNKEYYMWQLTIFFTAAYLLSLFLVKKKYLSFIVNRKIWNILLLISFAITIFTSIVLLLQLNYGIDLYSSLNISFLHIEIGYIMILISIYHTLWHIPYFKSYFS